MDDVQEDGGADRHIKDYVKKKPLHLAEFLKYGDCIARLEDMKTRMAKATGEFLLES